MVRPVVADGGGLVPGVQPHSRVQAGGAGAQGRGLGLTSGDLIGEDKLDEVDVGHFLLPGPHTVTAADPIPDDLRQAFDAINGRGGAHSYDVQPAHPARLRHEHRR